MFRLCETRLDSARVSRVYLKSHRQISGHRFFSCVFFEEFSSFGFTFRCVIRFELIFVMGIRSVSRNINHYVIIIITTMNIIMHKIIIARFSMLSPHILSPCPINILQLNTNGS